MTEETVKTTRLKTEADDLSNSESSKKWWTFLTKIPLPMAFATAITTLVSLPLANLQIFERAAGNFNIPIFISFMVWAQYFLYGAKWKKACRVILPNFGLGIMMGFAGIFLTQIIYSELFTNAFNWHDDPKMPIGAITMFATMIGLGTFLVIDILVLERVPHIKNHSLSYFNGLGAFLAIYYTGSFPEATANLGSGGGGPSEALEATVTSPYLLIIIACCWTFISGYLGLFLGWFNLAIVFPKKKAKNSEGNLKQVLKNQKTGTAATK